MAGKNQNEEPMDDGFEILEDSSIPVGGRRRDPSGALVDVSGRTELNMNGSNMYFDLLHESGLPKHQVLVKFGVNMAQRCVTVHLRPENTAGCTSVTIADRNRVSFNMLSVFERHPKLQPASSVKAPVSFRVVKGEKALCIDLNSAKEHHSQPRKSNNNKSNNNTKQSKTDTQAKPETPKQDDGPVAS